MDILFSFVHVLNVPCELLHEAPELGLTALHLLVHCIQSVALVSDQQVPYLVILGYQSFFPVSRRVLQERSDHYKHASISLTLHRWMNCRTFSLFCMSLI